MLTGDALIYFCLHVKHSEAYEEANSTLRKRYNNLDERSRFPAKWKSMLLTD